MVGDAEFSSLYIDVDYMDVRALQRVLELAQKGFPICFKTLPSQPGKAKTSSYVDMIKEIISMPNVSDDWSQVATQPPLISGDSIPDHWCRVTNEGDYIIFLAQPLAKGLEYPIYSGQSIMEEGVHKMLQFRADNLTIEKEIEFKTISICFVKDLARR